MKKLLMLDFASEMNRGDAAMQEAILDIVDETFQDFNKQVVCVYGDNQEEAFEKHFDCSRLHGVEITPGLRSSFNPLSDKFKAISRKKLRSLIAMLLAYVKLLILFVTFGRLHLGSGQRAVSALRTADIILWNGRNFRDRAGIGEFYDLMAMLLHPLIGLIYGRKIYAVGVSIWPLRYKLSRSFLRFVLSKCEYVTARESFSYKYATEELNLSNVRQYPDLSYYFIDKYRNNDDIERDPKLVSFTLVDWREDGSEVRDAYKKAISATMTELVDKGYKVQVVPQVYFEWEGYTQLLNEIYKENPSLKGQVHEIKEYLTPKQLFAEYRRSACLVATRMHSAIFALTHQCKVICIPYDAGAKWHIVTDMGLNHKYLINYRDVSVVALLNAFNSILADSDVHVKINSNLPKLIELTPEPIRLMEM